MTTDGAIGKDGDLCVKSRQDLAFFSRITKNTTVVMGRLTAESLPNGPLPNRNNIVLSSSGAYEWIDSTTTIPIEHFDIATLSGDVFIIGGKSLFERYLPLADTLFITKFEYDCLDQIGVVRMSPEFIRTTIVEFDSTLVTYITDVPFVAGIYKYTRITN
jgi:dihydrofolate reductase